METIREKLNAEMMKYCERDTRFVDWLIHEEATRIWKADCDRLASEGVPKKNWPKGPTRPRKPKLPATLDAVVDEDNGEDEEEDEHWWRAITLGKASPS